MTPPIPTRAEFIQMLTQPPGWLSEAVIGLSADDLDATPLIGKWSYRAFIAHILEADLGWTDILYRAVRPLRPAAGIWDPHWKAAYATRLATGDIGTAIAVMNESHADVATWINRLSDDDFLHPFPGVLWLVDAGLKVVVADSARWGLYLHAYYHLAFMQRHRIALGKPLPALDRYLVRSPGFDHQTPWPPWTK